MEAKTDRADIVSGAVPRTFHGPVQTNNPVK